MAAPSERPAAAVTGPATVTSRVPSYVPSPATTRSFSLMSAHGPLFRILGGLSLGLHPSRYTRDPGCVPSAHNMPTSYMRPSYPTCNCRAASSTERQLARRGRASLHGKVARHQPRNHSRCKKLGLAPGGRIGATSSPLGRLLSVSTAARIIPSLASPCSLTKRHMSGNGQLHRPRQP